MARNHCHDVDESSFVLNMAPQKLNHHVCEDDSAQLHARHLPYKKSTAAPRDNWEGKYNLGVGKDKVKDTHLELMREKKKRIPVYRY
jgi:hypothetical protein